MVFHYTLFFDAQNATPDNAGLFSFSSVQLGTEAATTAPAPDGQLFAWPGSDLPTAPSGSQIFFTFFETSGAVQMEDGLVPACWIKPIMGVPPVTPPMPTFGSPQELLLVSQGEGENTPPFLGAMNPDGFELDTEGQTYSLKVVARVRVPGEDAPRIFRTPGSLFVIAPPPPLQPGELPTAGDIFDVDVTSAGE